jgi:hypothetical protein
MRALKGNILSPPFFVKTHFFLKLALFRYIYPLLMCLFSSSSPKLKRTGIGRRGLFGTKSSTYPKLYFHDREEVVKSNIRDPLQIIKIIHENEHLGFLYMIPAVPRSSIEYDTYNLK